MNGNDFYRRLYRGFLYWLIRFAQVMASLMVILPLPPVCLLAAAIGCGAVSLRIYGISDRLPYGGPDSVQERIDSGSIMKVILTNR